MKRLIVPFATAKVWLSDGIEVRPPPPTKRFVAMRAYVSRLSVLNRHLANERYGKN